ncbi:glycosyl hydrolase [Clostridium butyricum]|uniref:glycosyl hydrolase n=1 Tax=Clostridium butyricum TaxID=1492 RepID=UPI00168BE49D|nr:glycosyl hydrolase [Clostridium butyricum]MDB2153206.1 glycosyl hydrolase [Clostridium butyricum]
MNKKKILKLTAAAMAITTVSSLNQGRIVKAVEKNVQLSELDVKDESLVINDNEKISDEENAIVSEEQKGDELEKSNFEIETQTSTGSSVFYVNDFENGGLPDEVNIKGVDSLKSVSIGKLGESENALKVESSFDGTTDWDSNKHEFTFYTHNDEEIPADSMIQFDVLIPKENEKYNGTIKYSGGIGDKDWNWKGAGYGDINSKDFEDQGNGYLKKTVSVKTSDNSEGLTKVILQLSGYECTYAGDIYIDNIKLIKAEKEEGDIPDVEPVSWSFDNSNEGWNFGGAYSYNGPQDNVVNFDEEKQGLRLDVDYSKNVGDSWSEFKIEKKFEGEKLKLNGYNVLTYDFIYDPNCMTTGTFKAKLFITDGPNKDVAIDLSNAEDLGNGLKKAQAVVEFNNADIEADSIILGLVGSDTDYKGSIYIDNIKLSQAAQEDPYVEKTVEPVKQGLVSVDSLEMPSEVKLVDNEATQATADLYAYLKALGKTDKVIYGHQNDTHHKALYKQGTNSDTKDVTGSIAGIIGMDTLSFTGDELELTDEEKKEGLTLPKKAAQIDAQAAKEGAIITLSSHMPNFEIVKNKELVDGKYDYSGYSPNKTSGNIVSRIMPGGDLNEVYTGYLDLIAEYADELQKENVPVLFRPFHENNGSWFWWGGAFCDAQSYKNLFAYTVDYLRNTKNIHNFLYVYSPNGPFENDKEYLSRYPGDEYIDILAFDMYHDDPMAEASKDPWMESLKETINLVQGIADSKGKLSAVSETGIRINGGGMPETGNPNKTWFKNVSDIISKSDMPYYMVWANFNNTDNFFAPFMANDKKGHEMINEFIDYYNDKNTVFADRIDDYASVDTQISDKYAYGYIMTPISNDRILEPVTIKAAVRNTEGKVTFDIKNKDGQVMKTLEATDNDGVFSAVITEDVLNEIGQVSGTIELKSDNTVLNYINVVFNIKEAEKQPRVVDDFESYMGDSSLLSGAWSTNKGPGCSVNPKLSDENKHTGDYGLAFNYKISTEKTSEGYAGIIKSLEADWTGCDALQIWAKPDGKGQKLVIQLTSNGEDFEIRLPEFTKTNESQLLKLPFSDFTGKKGGKLDPSNITSMAIYCNTIVPEDNEGSWNVDSTMYFDDIKAINTSESEAEIGNTSVNISGIQKVGYTLTPIVKVEDKEGNEITNSLNLKYYWYQMDNDKDEVNDTNSLLIGTDKTYKIARSDYNKYIKLVVKYVDNNGEEKEISHDYTKSKITFKSSGSHSSSNNSSSDNESNLDNDTSSSENDLSGDSNSNSVITEVITNEDGTSSIKLVDANGKIMTGWQFIDNKWYLGDENGIAKTDWQQVNGKWYYLENNGQMKTGWLKDKDGTWYHLQANGAMQIGWLKDSDGKWYYLKENGAMSIGWLRDTNGAWYYLNNSGAMQTGWIKDADGTWYYLNQSGAMLSNTIVDGYVLNKDGAWVK